MIPTLRAYYRLIAFSLITIYYASKLIISSALFGQVPRRGIGIRQLWGIRSLKAMNVKIEVQAPMPEGAHLFVSNHRNYIDGAVLPRFVPGSIIIKKEVGDWPVLGYGARSSFSIMIDRKDPNSRKQTREEIGKLLKQGYSVTVFPEGTTNAPPGIGELRPGPFQAAMEGGFTIAPIALEYKNPEDAWIGDDTFVRHFLQCFRQKEVRMKLKFGTPVLITDAEADRIKIQDWMQQETLRMRGEFDNGI